MPDRQTPQPPPVVVAVNQSDPPGPAYAGEERRQSGDSRANVNVNLQQPPTDQAMLWGVPAKAQGWVRLGSLGLITLAAVVLVWDNRQGSRRLEDREVARYNEWMELQRVRETQHAQSQAAMVAKFDALISKQDAAMDRMTSAGNEVRTTRISLEQTITRVEDALTRLYAELKRLVPTPRKAPVKSEPDKDGPEEAAGGFLNPILWLFDHDPPKVMPGEPELAPRPHLTGTPTP